MVCSGLGGGGTVLSLSKEAGLGFGPRLGPGFGKGGGGVGSGGGLYIKPLYFWGGVLRPV